jgi:hypothetical protein
VLTEILVERPSIAINTENGIIYRGYKKIRSRVAILFAVIPMLLAVIPMFLAVIPMFLAVIPMFLAVIPM